MRLLALDLDGTSLTPEGGLSPGLGSAVWEARERGVTVILATGRMVQSAARFHQSLGLEAGPMIALNGAVVVRLPEREIWLLTPVNEAAARILVTLAIGEGFVVQVYVHDELWVSEDSERVREYVHNNQVPVWVRGAAEMAQWPEAPIKILVQGEPAQLDRFRRVAGARLAGYPVRLFKSQADYLEMVDHAVGKGKALAQVARRLSIAQARVMAIGDNENDVDMLAWAGIGVAMGQSAPGIQRMADYVTGTVQGGGAAQAIRHFVLGEPSPTIVQGGKLRAPAGSP